MRPQEALAAVVRAIQTSPFFDPGDIITDEFDPEGRNNRLETPFVVVLPVGTVRDQSVNTDRVDFITDDSGSRVGEVYEAVFEMDIQSDIYLARGDDRNVTTLGGRLRRALYQHDSAAIADPFPDDPDDADVVDDIRDFDVGTGQRADDLSGPGVRRWRHESSMRFVSRVATTDGIQPFETVVTPTDPDLDAADADSIDFEYRITT